MQTDLFSLFTLKNINHLSKCPSETLEIETTTWISHPFSSTLRAVEPHQDPSWPYLAHKMEQDLHEGAPEPRQVRDLPGTSKWLFRVPGCNFLLISCFFCYLRRYIYIYIKLYYI